jgi:uncharacterized membrane protein
MRKKTINYIRRDYKPTHNNDKTSFTLPTPAMLESYEEISPGFTKELLELVKKEQENKRANENNYLKSLNTTVRFGQILAFVFSALVLLISFSLFSGDNHKGATTIFVTWFVFLFLINKKVKNKIK